MYLFIQYNVLVRINSVIEIKNYKIWKLTLKLKVVSNAMLDTSTS